MVSLFFLISCEKEEQVSKNLWNKSGTWNINKIELDDPTVFPIKLELRDAGEFHFSKDGTGDIQLNIYGQKFEEEFTYTNTENTITLKGTGNNMVISDDEMIFDMTWKKNYIIMENEQVVEEIDEDNNVVTTTKSTKIILRKIKK